jgi:hypothetical protein
MSTNPATIEREERDCIPATIQQILNSNQQSSWSVLQNDNGKIHGFRFSIELRDIYQESSIGTRPERVVWVFNDNKKIISKTIIMKVPAYNIRSIARYFIEGKHVSTIHRLSKGNQCWELQAVMGDCTVEWCYKWDVGTTLFPTLEQELDVHVTLLLPFQSTFDNICFYKGYHPQIVQPSNLLGDITDRLFRQCNEKGYLLYRFNKHTNIQLSTIDCTRCGNDICLWDSNVEPVIKDYELLYKHDKGVEQQTIVTLQFEFIMRGFKNTQKTIQLPQCVLDGIDKNF